MKSQNFEQWDMLHYTWDSVRHFISKWHSLPGVHTIHFEDTASSIDIYVNELVQNSSKTTLPVFFSGAISKRGNKKGPFFSGRGMSNDLQIPAISVSDTILDQNIDLNLGWHLGAVGEKFENNLIQVLEAIQNQLQKEYIFVGGSGGGFASLNFARHFGQKSSVLVWNPQTDIYRYAERFTKAYLRQSFGFSHKILSAKDWKEFSKLRTSGKITTSLIAHETLLAPRRVLYLQNSGDSHKKIHLQPLWEVTVDAPLAEGLNSIDENHIVYVDNFSDGHNPPPADLIASILHDLTNTEISVESILAPMLSKN